MDDFSAHGSYRRNQTTLGADMSLLTDQDIDALWADEPTVPQKVKRRELVRIAQAAVIKKLAGVSLEPKFHEDFGPNGNHFHYYTATQLAAARVQFAEQAAIMALSTEGASSQDISDAIRATR